jgi:hypothetical protein
MQNLALQLNPGWGPDGGPSINGILMINNHLCRNIWVQLYLYRQALCKKVASRTRFEFVVCMHEQVKYALYTDHQGHSRHAKVIMTGSRYCCFEHEGLATGGVWDMIMQTHAKWRFRWGIAQRKTICNCWTYLKTSERSRATMWLSCLFLLWFFSYTHVNSCVWGQGDNQKWGPCV